MWISLKIRNLQFSNGGGACIHLPALVCKRSGEGFQPFLFRIAQLLQQGLGPRAVVIFRVCQCTRLVFGIGNKAVNPLLIFDEGVELFSVTVQEEVAEPQAVLLPDILQFRHGLHHLHGFLGRVPGGMFMQYSEHVDQKQSKDRYQDQTKAPVQLFANAHVEASSRPLAARPYICFPCQKSKQISTFVGQGNTLLR